MRISLAALAACAVVMTSGMIPPALAQSGAPASPPLSISLTSARVIIDEAVAYTNNVAKSRAAIVVLDAAGHVVSIDRMENASFHLVKFAQGKAFGSIVTRQPTQALVDMAKTRPDRLAGIVSMYPGEIYAVGGGVPIAVDGKLIGAIGIAGLPEGVDEKAALAGIEAFKKTGAKK